MVKKTHRIFALAFALLFILSCLGLSTITKAADEPTAIGDLQPIQVATEANNKNGGTVTGGGTYNVGDTVTVTATPNDGFVFELWENQYGTMSDLPTFTFTAEEDMDMLAHFWQISIEPASIASQEYTGDPIEPQIGKVQLIGVDGEYLEATDYTVSYSNNINVGTGKITVTFNKDNENLGFVGSKTIGFDITQADLAGATVTVDDQEYTGKELKPVPKVVWHNKEVSPDDYTVSYKNNKEVGTATVIITGKRNFYGEVSGTFQIKEKPVKYYTVRFISGRDKIIKLPDSITVKEGTSLFEAGIPRSPIMRHGGNIFTGWFLDEDFKTSFSYDEPITSDITLYARVEKKNSPSQNNEDGPVPKTRDESQVGIWIALLGLSVLTIGGVVVARRKRREE